MKNFSLLFVTFLLMQLSTLAQEGWFWQNPSAPRYTLNDVFVIDDNNAIAVGNNGTILKSTNLGNDWYDLTGVTTRNLNSVNFIDENNGWIVGADRIVLKTNDGGDNWEIIVAPDTFGCCIWYNSAHFVNQNTGWVIEADDEGEYENLFGSRIFKTTDGGYNWEQNMVQQGNSGPNSLYFLDSNYGWAVQDYSDSISVTTNGGGNWINYYCPYRKNSVYFVDNNYGWIVGGGGSISKSSDGGQSWTEQQSGTNNSLNSIHFKDSNIGWAVGEFGTIVSTSNGGEVWTAQNFEGIANLQSVHGLNDAAITVGLYGVNINTTDGGVNWDVQSSSFTYETLYSVFMVDNQTGWAAGTNGAILNTNDGGSNWISQSLTGNKRIRSLYFTDSNNGWAAGYDFDNAGNFISNTTDAGSVWNVQYSYSASQSNEIRSLYFANNQLGWAVGEGGLILKTNDGGLNWESKLNGLLIDLRAVCFRDELNGFAVGQSDIMLKTYDGGENWEVIPRPYGWLNSIYLSGNFGWIVGNNGTILKTTNFGVWNDISTSNYANLYSVHFENIFYGWAVGDGPTILRTTDGGSNWNEQLINNHSIYGLYSVFFTDNNNGWVMGEGGTILHTTNGGVSFVEEQEIDEIPTDYNLTNNFPNPFNPSTKIKYSIPQNSSVVIKVFDVLGNEIETLVNEEKPVGTYEITWYAEGLPSGVYFYRIQAGSFVETKKMVLLR